MKAKEREESGESKDRNGSRCGKDRRGTKEKSTQGTDGG